MSGAGLANSGSIGERLTALPGGVSSGAIKSRHSGEGRDPFFNQLASGQVDPGLRRDDGFAD
jgi:hypothetical protein